MIQGGQGVQRGQAGGGWEGGRGETGERGMHVYVSVGIGGCQLSAMKFIKKSGAVPEKRARMRREWGRRGRAGVSSGRGERGGGRRNIKSPALA